MHFLKFKPYIFCSIFLIKLSHWGWLVWKLTWGMASDLSLVGLSKLLQKHEGINDYALESKELLKWPSLKKKGLINMHTMALNSDVVLVVLEKWVPQLDKLKTLNLAQIKNEVGYDWFFIVLQELFIPNFQFHDWGTHQVLLFREKFKMRTEDSIVHCDAVAIRSFVTMCFRRHDGHKRKVHWLQIVYLIFL